MKSTAGRPSPGSISRRHVLATAAAGATGLAWGAAGATPARVGVVSLRAPERMMRLHAGGDGALLAVSSSGALWRLAADGWQRLGAGLDPASPVAAGFDRVVGRSREGGLWVLESGRVSSHTRAALAPHAGLLVLALGVIAIEAAREGRHHAVRLEPGARGWHVSARSKATVLPDARPVRFDPSGTSSDDDGHVAVLAGPDATRYRHGVLGDGIEATSLLLLERHGLEPLAQLELPAPFVFEDIAPRPVAWRGQRGLLTVRSGPDGAQLAIVAPSRGRGGQLALAALGPSLGPQRWLAPSTDGERLLAVHTPHIGGVLHHYRADGDRLAGNAVAHEVSNHAIGQRDLDVSAWVGARWVVPVQDRRALHVFDLEGATGQPREVPLGQPAIALQRWRRDGRDGVALLLQDGSAGWVGVA